MINHVFVFIFVSCIYILYILKKNKLTNSNVHLIFVDMIPLSEELDRVLFPWLNEKSNKKRTQFCLGANESKSAANGAARTKEQVSRLDSAIELNLNCFD